MTVAYKVEELLALRDSVSESAVSFDRFGDEDAIKEHVLRSTASASAIATRQDIGEPRAAAEGSTKKPSPSPSIKRGKVERLIKEHGSPPGMRVTAGGRVVPNDLLPIGGPRYTANPSKMHDHKNHQLAFSQSHSGQPGNMLAAVPNGMVAYNAASELCQVVGGQLVPLRLVNGICQFILPPVQNFIGQTVQEVGPQFMNNNQFASLPQAVEVAPNVPLQPYQIIFSEELAQVTHRGDTDINLRTLEAWYTSMDNLNKDLERLEVVHEDTQPPEWKAQVIELRKHNIVELDRARKLIKRLKETERAEGPIAAAPTEAEHAVTRNENQQPNNAPPLAEQNTIRPKLAGQTVESGNFQFVPPNIPYAQQYPPAYNPLLPVGLPYQSNFGLPGHFSSIAAPFPVPSVENEHPEYPQWNTSVIRRSHAVEIKDPQVNDKKINGRQSKLNPASPVYEPGKLPKDSERSSATFVPPSPSPIASPKCSAAVRAQHPWLFESGEDKESYPSREEDAQLQRASSMTSASTADFFPTNTHEHSINKASSAQVRFSVDSPTNTLFSGNSFPLTPQKALLLQSREPNEQHPLKENMKSVATPKSSLEFSSSPWNRDSNKSKSFADRKQSEADMTPSRVISGTRNPGIPAGGTPSMNPTKSLFSTNSLDINLTQVSQDNNLKNRSVTMDDAGAHGFPAGSIYPPEFLEGYKAAKSGDSCSKQHDKDFVQGYCMGLQENYKISAALSRQPSLATSHTSQSLHSAGPTPPDSAISVSFNANKNHLAFAMNNSVPVPPAINSAPAEVTTFRFNPDANIWGFPGVGQIGKAQRPSRFPPGNIDTRRPSLTQSRGPRYRHELKSPNENIGFNEGLPHISEKPRGENMEQARSFSHMTLPKKVLDQQQRSTSADVTALAKQQPMRMSLDQLREAQPHNPTGLSRFSAARLSQCDGAGDEIVETPLGRGVTNSPKGNDQSAQADPTTSSPKKAGSSPTKAKLEQIIKFAKPNKGKKAAAEPDESDEPDPARMTPQEKRRFRESWAGRFRKLKVQEREEIEEYRKENPI